MENSRPKDKLKLIRHPFIINDKSDLQIFFYKDKYEYRFSKDPCSKKVYSTLCTGIKNYIEVEIIDGICKMLAETREIHEFQDPVDFYVPISAEAKKFYSDIHNCLMDPDMEKLCEKRKKYQNF